MCYVFHSCYLTKAHRSKLANHVVICEVLYLLVEYKENTKFLVCIWAVGHLGFFKNGSQFGWSKCVFETPAVISELLERCTSIVLCFASFRTERIALIHIVAWKCSNCSTDFRTHITPQLAPYLPCIFIFLPADYLSVVLALETCLHTMYFLSAHICFVFRCFSAML